jgi:hypothetical protein
MIITKDEEGDWKLSDGIATEMVVPVEDLTWLHHELEMALDAGETEKVVFTYYDRTDAMRAMHSLDLVLALSDLEDDYRAWEKYGSETSVTLEKLRDHFYDTLREHNVDIYGFLN